MIRKARWSARELSVPTKGVAEFLFEPVRNLVEQAIKARLPVKLIRRLLDGLPALSFRKIAPSMDGN